MLMWHDNIDVVSPCQVSIDNSMGTYVAQEITYQHTTLPLNGEKILTS